MKKEERIEALEIAKKYDIKAVRSWWNPFQNVQWAVLKSRKKLTHEQYYYLSNNNFIQPKKEIKKGEEIILQISELGKQKLIKLKTNV